MKTLKNFFEKTHIKLLCLFIVAMFCAVSALAFSTPIDAEAEKASPTIVSETETIQASRTITTAAQLVSFANLVNAGSNRSDVVTLANNIDMSSYSSFTPIGKSSSYSFKGTFNGNGFAITGLTVNGGSYDRGLFGYLEGATIKNLIIQGGSVTGNGGYSAAGFAGSAKNSSFSYCYNFGTTITSASSGATTIGGIVGYSTNNSISSCYNTGTVKTASGATTICAGGICGIVDTGSINYCTNKGAITAGTTSSDYSYAGGAFGKMIDGSLSHFVNYGAIKAYAKENSSSGNITINETSVGEHGDKVSAGLGTSKVTTVDKQAYVGGIGGLMEAGTATEMVNLDYTDYRDFGGYERLHYSLYYKMTNKYGLFWASTETTYTQFHCAVYKEVFYNTVIGYVDDDASISQSLGAEEKISPKDIVAYYHSSSTIGVSVNSMTELVADTTILYQYQSENSPITLKFYLGWYKNGSKLTTPHVMVFGNSTCVTEEIPYWGCPDMKYPRNEFYQVDDDYDCTLIATKYSSYWALNSSNQPYLKRFYWANNASTPS